MNTCFLSVTIATYNRPHLLKKCLLSLEKQTLDKKKFEIIVCDSNSEVETSNVILQFRNSQPGVEISHLHTRNVLAAKRNLGIKSAKGNIIVFFDDDCIPDKNCLLTYFQLFSVLSEVEKKTIYCGEVRFPEKWVESSNYYRFRDSRHFGSGRRKDLKKLSYRTIVVMNMAFLKDELLSSVKKVNENFVGYGSEDQDLGWRLEQAGFILKKSSAKIMHYEDSGTIKGYEKKLFHTARDGVKTLMKDNLPAYSHLRAAKFLDKEYPHSSKSIKLFYASLRAVIFHKNIAKLFRFFLIKTDKIDILYFPSLYRYVLAYAYIQGVNARNATIVENNWYD
jgi:glycosyltransferase involved in cell wall biosynthesis